MHNADMLQISDLRVSFHTDEGVVRAVDGVSFSVRRGEVLGVVGESGCGKTVTAMSVLRLIPCPPGRIDAGRILFDGRDLLQMPIGELRGLRGRRISMIFQEPSAALSPLHRVGAQLVETWQLHEEIDGEEAWRRSQEWLARVGIPEAGECMHRYPYQLSGGMKQRVMIAMALMMRPDLVIADEPTTALDVTIQAQIFDLMRAMKEADTSLMLITHDMGTVWEMCDRVAVMYAGRVVEEGPVREVFARPRHPYTQGLMAAMPRSQAAGARLAVIPGQVPSARAYPKTCRFADRCALAFDRCRTEDPALVRVGPDQQAACFLAEQEAVK